MKNNGSSIRLRQLVVTKKKKMKIIRFTDPPPPRSIKQYTRKCEN